MKTKALKLQNAILHVVDEVDLIVYYKEWDHTHAAAPLRAKFCAIKYKHKCIAMYYLVAWRNGTYSPNTLPTYEDTLERTAGTIYAWLFMLDMAMWFYEDDIENTNGK